MVGVGNICRSKHTAIVLTVGSTIAEVLLVAVGKSIHLRVPVTGTPRSLGGVLKRQAVVLQHVQSDEELLGVFGTVEHGVERYRSTGRLLNEGVTELHGVGTGCERHTANHQRHNPCYDFMM